MTSASRSPSSSSTTLSTTALVLVWVASFLCTVNGHGAMVGPRFRGTLATFSLSISKLIDEPISDCPHCLNAGGKGAVTLAAGPAGWRPYLPTARGPKAPPFRRDAGLCGDAIADPVPRLHEVGGTFGPPPSMPYSAVYRMGSVIELTADITTNHNGFFEFFICDVTKCGGDINEQCFTRGHCEQLMRVKTPECEGQKSRECGPVDPIYPGRWYVPCRRGAHVGEHFMGGEYMRYKLPNGFNSRHAVIQWYWATANSCNPPGFIEYFERYPMPGWGTCPGDGGALGGRSPSLSKCGGPTFPEEFWMCADVQVTRDGKPTTPFKPPQNFVPPTPSPDSIPTPTPTPTSTPKLDDNKEDDQMNDEANKNDNQNSNGNQDNNGNDGNGEGVSQAEEVNRCRALLGLEAPKVPPKKSQSKTQKPRRTPKPTPTSKPAPSGSKSKKKCASNWKQCGGKYYTGPKTCCDSAYKCVYINKYYAHCKTEKRKKSRRNGRKSRKNSKPWHASKRGTWQKQRYYPN